MGIAESEDDRLVWAADAREPYRKEPAQVGRDGVVASVGEVHFVDEEFQFDVGTVGIRFVCGMERQHEHLIEGGEQLRVAFGLFEDEVRHAPEPELIEVRVRRVSPRLEVE